LKLNLLILVVPERFLRKEKEKQSFVPNQNQRATAFSLFFIEL